MTNMEGLDTNLECETVERNCNVQWFKDNVEIINQLDKVKIKKTKERLHTLFISKTSLEDSGTYSIQIKGVKSIAKLDVKGNQCKSSFSISMIKKVNTIYNIVLSFILQLIMRLSVQSLS